MSIFSLRTLSVIVSEVPACCWAYSFLNFCHLLTAIIFHRQGDNEIDSIATQAAAYKPLPSYY